MQTDQLGVAIAMTSAMRAAVAVDGESIQSKPTVFLSPAAVVRCSIEFRRGVFSLFRSVFRSDPLLNIVPQHGLPSLSEKWSVLVDYLFIPSYI